jgi:hypothetical protein
MINLQKLVIDRLSSALEEAYLASYGDRLPLIGRTAAWCGQLALENIANSDALYHDLEHTVMVTLVGQAILQGKHLCEGGIAPQDWLHVTIALLCHDIGYVRGICRDDNERTLSTGRKSETIELSPLSTDAALAPYHVDRSKRFIEERFSQPLFLEINIRAITDMIEMTRFPVPNEQPYLQTDSLGALVRAADLIGQLGDPNYLRKLPALHYEMQESVANAELVYKDLAEMRDNYARFYWEQISPYIQPALRYLRVTQEGKQWIANLYAHVFYAEHSFE